MNSTNFNQFHFKNANDDNDILAKIANIGDNISNGIVTYAKLSFGMMLAKGLISSMAKKFIESDNVMPKAMIYADWWPSTCQKVKNLANTFWLRRFEGATATTIASTTLFASWLYCDSYKICNFIWNNSNIITNSLLDKLSISSYSNSVVTYLLLPSAVGLGVTAVTGINDLISKYLQHDPFKAIKPIFNANLESAIDEIADEVVSAEKTKSFLPNILLYGPPGTGKTMISKWIARKSKMNYILLSGGDLAKVSNEKSGNHIEALKKLISHASSLNSPTIIFIDEAEAFCKDRSKVKNIDLVTLSNSFLAQTSQPSSKLMFIFATNLPEELDPAVKSRCGYKLHVGLPELAERENIIKVSINKLYNSIEHLFTEDIIKYFAEKTKGLSGRDIIKILNRINGSIIARGTCLDKEAIDQAVKRFVNQEREMEIQRPGNSLETNPFYKEIASASDDRST